MYEGLEEQGFTEDQIKILKPLVDAEKDKSFSAGFGKTSENVDSTVKEIFGIDKEEKEMSTDYLKRVHGIAVKGIESSAKTKYEKTITELNEKIKNSKGDETLKADLEKTKADFEALRETHNGKMSEYEEFKLSSESEKDNILKDFKIKQSLSSLGLEHADKDYLNYKLSGFIDSIKENFEVVESEGKLILKGGEKNQFKNHDLVDFAKSELKDLLKSDSGVVNPSSSDVNSNSTKSKIAASANKGDALEIIKEELINEGSDPGSDDWSKKYSEKIELYKNEISKLNIL